MGAREASRTEARSGFKAGFAIARLGPSPVAWVDAGSGGGWVRGLGVAWTLPGAEREWAACGANHKAGVRRLEEHIAIGRRLGRGDPVTHRGEDRAVVDHTIGPPRWRTGGPPILITAG